MTESWTASSLASRPAARSCDSTSSPHVIARPRSPVSRWMRLRAMPALMRLTPLTVLVLEERLELDDGVVLASAGLQRASVEEPGALTHAGPGHVAHAAQGCVEVLCGFGGFSGLEGQLGVVQRQPHLVRVLPRLDREQRIDRHVEPRGERAERLHRRLASAGLEAGEIGDRHRVADHLALGQPPGDTDRAKPTTQLVGVGLGEQFGLTCVHSAIVTGRASRVVEFWQKPSSGLPR